jgi:hypothetical protein
MRNQAVSTFDIGSLALRRDSGTGSPLACRQRVASVQDGKKAMVGDCWIAVVATMPARRHSSANRKSAADFTWTMPAKSS